jgi:hypothetical protein
MLWHIVLTENFIELRVYFIKFWIMCADTTIHYCGTVYLIRVLGLLMCGYSRHISWTRDEIKNFDWFAGEFTKHAGIEPVLAELDGLWGLHSRRYWGSVKAGYSSGRKQPAMFLAPQMSCAERFWIVEYCMIWFEAWIDTDPDITFCTKVKWPRRGNNIHYIFENDPWQASG